MKALNVPHGSYGSIVTILRGAIAEDTNVAYKTLEKVSSGPASSIIDGSPEAEVVYKCQDRNLSISQTTCFLNLSRQKMTPSKFYKQNRYDRCEQTWQAGNKVLFLFLFKTDGLLYYFLSIFY